MTVDHNSLETILGKIKKEYPHDGITLASDKQDVKRIPINDIQLDYVTNGGIPLGRWSHFYGEQSGGKSLVAFKVIASAQKMGLNAAYYDVEKTFVPSWAERMGVNLSELIIVDGTRIEELGTKLEALLGAVNVHVIDSIAAAVSVDELATKAEDWLVGIAARTWGKVIRRAQERFDSEANAVILINQLRTAMRGRVVGDAPSGGRFIRYQAALELEFKRSSWLYRDKNGNLSADGEKTDSPTGDIEPDGIEFLVRVAKSKVGPPLRPARMRLDFETGQFDQMWSLAMFANYFGIVERNGAWYTINGGTKVQGEAGLRNYISENPHLAKEIEKKVLGGR